MPVIPLPELYFSGVWLETVPMSKLMRLFREEHATTSVEYAVMLAMILLVLIVGVAAFGTAQNSYWNNIDNQLQDNGF